MRRRRLCTAFDVYSQGLLFRDPNDDVDLLEERMFIASLLDYGNKYGMGHAFTDGSTGVHFNDSTPLVLAADKQCVLSLSLFFYGALIDPLRQALRLHIVAPPGYGVRPQEVYRHMRATSILARAGLVLSLLTFPALSASSSPPVKVSQRTSWPSPPFLLKLMYGFSHLLLATNATYPFTAKQFR
jgi:hypothetical protein